MGFIRFVSDCHVPVILALMLFLPATHALPQGSPNPLEHFPDDFYKVDGSPDLTVSLERSRVYQDQETSLFLTVRNQGSVSSFKVNNDPKDPEEVYAAKMELDLEKARTTAEDISVSLVLPEKGSPLEIKREVAYAGTLREGQVSTRLEFPVEVYENAPPGEYTLYAMVNYTYQLDVAVEPESSRPQNPDVFYLYQSKSQMQPIKLQVERRSGAEFRITSLSPQAIKVGSRDNIIKMTIENVGSDTARDLVARLRPESGIYVSVDESPIPALAPGETAQLVYKVDVSKDAVPGKRYMLKLFFEFKDSFREDLTDSENAYLMIGPQGFSPLLALGVAGILAASALVVLRKRMKSS